MFDPDHICLGAAAFAATLFTLRLYAAFKLPCDNRLRRSFDRLDGTAGETRVWSTAHLVPPKAAHPSHAPVQA